MSQLSFSILNLLETNPFLRVEYKGIVVGIVALITHVLYCDHNTALLCNIISLVT